MQGHADPQGPGLSPAFLGQGSLRGQGGAKGICGSEESRLDGIADVLIEEAVVILNRCAEEIVMARHGCTHRVWVTLPKSRAPFDVSEEKGDGAAGQLRHGMPLTGRCRWVLR
jgi:hypothetical protein